MATLVKYTTHESEVRILYEYLAEASVVFPKVFPVIHSLLDAKITNVLSLCHDKTILAAVQAIIENMIACEDEKSQQQLHFLQVRKLPLNCSTCIFSSTRKIMSHCRVVDLVDFGGLLGHLPRPTTMQTTSSYL